MVRFQKLTRNLFLTLHKHNVHRQQQQLSKFLMRYQFASHAYCRAMGQVSKMTSQQEKAFCVLRFEASRSVIRALCEFCAHFRKEAPCRNNITRWYRQFVETGCLCKGKSWLHSSFVYTLYIYKNICVCVCVFMSMINKSQKLLLAATSVKQHYSSLYTKCIL